MSDCVPDSCQSMAPYAEARRQAILSFERAYVLAVLSKSGGNVSAAARNAKIDRVYLHRLMRRHRASSASVRPAISDPSTGAAQLVGALQSSLTP